MSNTNNQTQAPRANSHQAGLSVINLLAAIAISSILILAFASFVGRSFTVSRTQFEQVRVTEDGRRELERMSDTIRNARYVDQDGDIFTDKDSEAWLQVAGDSEIKVFTNLDADPDTELVRYFVIDNELHRAVDSGTAQTLVRSLRNLEVATPLFTYYLAGSTVPLPTPLDAATRRLVQRVGIALKIDVNERIPPPLASIVTQVFPRAFPCLPGDCNLATPSPSPSLSPSPSTSPSPSPSPACGSPPTVNVYANPSSVIVCGEFGTVGWDSNLTAISCSASGPWQTCSSGQSCSENHILYRNQIYQVTCTNACGSTTSSVTIGSRPCDPVGPGGEGCNCQFSP